jgi:CBS domain-containing protein
LHSSPSGAAPDGARAAASNSSRSLRNVVTAGPEEALAGIARRLPEYNVGTVVIVEDRRPVGISTDRDLALAPGARGLSWSAS